LCSKFKYLRFLYVYTVIFKLNNFIVAYLITYFIVISTTILWWTRVYCTFRHIL